MELGNALFGHSRGTYPLKREAGFEEELYRLFEACAPDRDDASRQYGLDFENNVFSIFPYYWGDCTCGYTQKEKLWDEENEHEPQCYQSALKRERAEWLAKHPEPDAQIRNTSYEELEEGIVLMVSLPAHSPSADMWRAWHTQKEKAEEKIYDRLCAEFGVDRKHGYGVHCTCNYSESWRQFCEENSHDPNCPIVKPNFLYKPTGFELHWYKYPLRDSYTNQKITLAGFKKIISACIESCKADSPDLEESRAESYIKDWNWNAASRGFALQMGAFLLEFMDSLRASNLSADTIRKHQSNCWLIGAFECDYGYHKKFAPTIFLHGPGFLYEFERKVSDSKYAVDSYKSTWRKLEKYVRSLRT
jgi:hypothetical protein